MNDPQNDFLLRALRQLPEVAPDEAFVTAVSARIQTRRRLLQALYALLTVAGLAALALLAPGLQSLTERLAAAPLLLLPLLQAVLLLLPLAALLVVLHLLWNWQRT